MGNAMIFALNASLAQGINNFNNEISENCKIKNLSKLYRSKFL